MAPNSPFYWLVQLLALICFSSAFTTLSDSSLSAIPDPGNDFNIKDGKLLSPLLRTRVPGTEGNIAAQNHFADFFKNDLPQWKVSYQNSSQKIPVMNNDVYPFTNLIVTRDPPWSSPGEVGYLTLVAHFDSLWTPEGFIGAIDSAAPCAMLMHAARSLDSMLTRKWDSMNQVGKEEEGYDGGIEGHKGIQILFLDGEEAFGQWSSTDSVYGARALAEEMEQTVHAAMSTYHNALSSISLFVLLDLLGAKGPSIPSYFKTTHWAYQRLATLEKRLRDAGKLKSTGRSWFPDVDKDDNGIWMGGRVGDDHVPFMARGVEVLHLIPSPFPDQWHSISDDGEHLDMDACADWAILTTAFAAEWMDLEGFGGDVPPPSAQRRARGIHDEKVTSKTEL